MRRGSSDLGWTIVVRFVNRPAGRRILSVFPLFLSHPFLCSIRIFPSWWWYRH